MVRSTFFHKFLIIIPKFLQLSYTTKNFFPALSAESFIYRPIRIYLQNTYDWYLVVAFRSDKCRQFCQLLRAMTSFSSRCAIRKSLFITFKINFKQMGAIEIVYSLTSKKIVQIHSPNELKGT